MRVHSGEWATIYNVIWSLIKFSRVSYPDFWGKMPSQDRGVDGPLVKQSTSEAHGPLFPKVKQVYRDHREIEMFRSIDIN